MKTRTSDDPWTYEDIENMRRLRFNGHLPLEKIGEMYNISRERVRQLIGNTGRQILWPTSMYLHLYDCGLNLDQIHRNFFPTHRRYNIRRAIRKHRPDGRIRQ